MPKRAKYNDITNTINVGKASAVRDEVLSLLNDLYPNYDTTLLNTTFRDIERLFYGVYPNYTFCDATYHDLQHTLDMTLALARLIVGSQRNTHAPNIKPEQATLALICALFHDSGYIRSDKDRKHSKGAEYTKTHVSRGAKFMASYLPKIGLGEQVFITNKMVHFTGYEVSIDRLQMHEPEYQMLGYMLGTADLVAQMADRCYLEKCRDRLYEEFVLGEADRTVESNGNTTLIYESAHDLLRKTPTFYEKSVLVRLNTIFEAVHEYATDYFGDNLYMIEVNKNIDYLQKVIDKNDFSMLRRVPLDNFGTNAALLNTKEQLSCEL